MKNIKNIVSVIVFSVFLITVSSVCLAKPDTQYSEAERRELAQFPETSAEQLVSGEFSKGFESYTTDQFPMRELMRKIKAAFSTVILGKAENNGLFYMGGHISKIDAQENEKMMDYAAEKFTYLRDTYLKDNKIYFSIIPDKNMFIAEKNGYPSLDYYGFADRMKSKVDFMEYVDIYDLLSADDYYNTDTHWRQEKITDIADRLLNVMGEDINGESYNENTLDFPFRGVYSGQYALNIPADTIKYLTNDTINNAIVTYYDTGMPKVGAMYNMDKATGKDPYEMFLSGAMPLVTIEKPSGNHDNHLILFRDSFGSSIAPLLLKGYDKITLIDTRYVQSGLLGNLVDFSGEDVLFLYSTSLLNSSLAIK